MIHVYLDASALVKRYRQEPGSAVVNDTVERLVADNPRRLIVSSLATVETLSILNRRRNEASIPLDDFRRVLHRVLQDLWGQALNHHFLSINTVDSFRRCRGRHTAEENQGQTRMALSCVSASVMT